MRIILTLIFIILSNGIFANEENSSQVEVINLYESKSLDQMVLDNLNDKEDFEEVNEDLDNSNEIQVNEVEVKLIEIKKDSFIRFKEKEELKAYFDNLLNINSKTLQKEIIDVLENLQFNFETYQDEDLFLLIVNYFKSIGYINKSYELVAK